MVTWDKAVAFCEWLSKKEGRTYRLPTDAEWSRAASGAAYLGDSPPVADLAWYEAEGVKVWSLVGDEAYIPSQRPPLSKAYLKNPADVTLQSGVNVDGLDFGDHMTTLTEVTPAAIREASSTARPKRRAVACSAAVFSARATS